VGVATVGVATVGVATVGVATVGVAIRHPSFQLISGPHAIGCFLEISRAKLCRHHSYTRTVRRPLTLAEISVQPQIMCVLC